MEEMVWSKINQFMKELRCEDVGRVSFCKTKEYRQALHNKSLMYEEYLQSLKAIPMEHEEKIEEYIEMIEICAEEECQQAYMQGYIDCVLAMVGAGILTPRTEVQKVINEIKE